MTNHRLEEALEILKVEKIEDISKQHVESLLDEFPNQSEWIKYAFHYVRNISGFEFQEKLDTPNGTESNKNIAKRTHDNSEEKNSNLELVESFEQNFASFPYFELDDTSQKYAISVIKICENFWKQGNFAESQLVELLSEFTSDDNLKIKILSEIRYETCKIDNSIFSTKIEHYAERIMRTLKNPSILEINKQINLIYLLAE